MVDFDATRLLGEFDSLSRWQTTAFVASCVEALLPSYVRFVELEDVGDVDLVAGTLEAVWAGLAAGPEGLAGLDLPTPDEVLTLLPQDEDWNEWSPQAENAVAALSFLVGVVRDGEPQLAVRAAQQAYEAADDFAARQDEDGGLLDAAGRAALLGSHTVQAELQRQEDAMRLVREAPAASTVVAELRATARSLAIGGATEN